MLRNQKKFTTLAVALLLVTITLTNSTFAIETQSLSASAESILGGNSCSDAANGFALGMGVATLFGCVWCGVGAVGAKAAALLFC